MLQIFELDEYDLPLVAKVAIAVLVHLVDREVTLYVQVVAWERCTTILLNLRFGHGCILRIPNGRFSNCLLGRFALLLARRLLLCVLVLFLSRLLAVEVVIIAEHRLQVLDDIVKLVGIQVGVLLEDP